uniref:Ribosomal protein S14 n=1 Tax=Ulva expansa TaxID=2293988 RepID=A0A3G2WCH5_9CHLO|nr:ribosomal protein S14 [Ulva expansa]AYO97745.1 ribosomal protein S14 [Ulva expansa]AYP41023.1 ribosomal protein S14 [Ulva expansa]
MTIIKNNYNFNTINQNQKYLALLKQSKQRFCINLLKSKLNPGILISASLKENTTCNKHVKNLIQTDWASFVYNKRTTSRKTIQTRFRSIISDQKKRIWFDNYELNVILLKSLLSIDRLVLTKLPLEGAYKIQKGNKDNCFNSVLNKNLSYAGPGLILEDQINRRFTKKQGLSNIRNRCIVTGRSSIIGKSRLSRISFRRYAGRGLIPGLIKRSH